MHGRFEMREGVKAGYQIFSKFPSYFSFIYKEIRQFFRSPVMWRKEEYTAGRDKKRDSLDVNVISDINIHLSEKKSWIITNFPCSPCRLMVTFLASSTILSGM